VKSHVQEEALAGVLVSRWQQASDKLEQLAAEIPQEKYDWRPRPGIRTCGEVLRHVAFWTQYLSKSLRGEQTDEGLNELPEAVFSTKATILEALRRSNADAVASMGDPRLFVDPKTAELVVTFIEHTAEHYGQLVVFARLLDVVPPASRV